MTSPANLEGAKRATYFSFFATGFGVACWAPLVPFAKARTGSDDSQLGLLLLCIGVGSVLTMPLTGWLSAKFGSRPAILFGGIGLAVLLPLLSFFDQAFLLALALLAFGASLGAIDVAMNIHAVDVERQSPRPLMSGFHAMFSVGGFAGSGCMTFLLSLGVAPFTAAVACGALTAAAVAMAWPHLLSARGEPLRFALPHGIVLLLAALCAITFLVEGAILDWSALLVVDEHLADSARGGLGYMLFSIAMTIGRLTGNRIIARVGDRLVLVWGGAATILGFAILLSTSLPLIAMAGFLLIGIGAANLVPVLFRMAGKQTVMPVGLAVAAVTTTGYAGILAGPSAIGFVAHATSLRTAFWLLAGLMVLVPLAARRVTKSQTLL